MEPQVPVAADTATISGGRLLQSIWFQPAATLQFILRRCPDRYVPVLLVLGGLARAIDRAAHQHSGDQHPTLAVLAFAVIAGGPTSWVIYYVYGWGMSIAGRWLGGRASAPEFRTVLAWALVPTIASLVLIIPQAIVFGDDLFRTEPPHASAFARGARLAFDTVRFALAGWALVILVSGVRLLQGFTAGRAVANVLLPGLMVVGSIVVIAQLVSLF